jgi:hypothetical protein
MMSIGKTMPALALAGALMLAAGSAAEAAPVWQGGGHGGHMGGPGGHSGNFGGHPGGWMGHSGHFSGHPGGYPGGHFAHRGHFSHDRGPFIEFYGDPFYNDYAYDYEYGYGYSCGYYRSRWHYTGNRYWLRRYEQCVEG